MTTPLAQKPLAPVTYQGIGTTGPGTRIVQGGGQGIVNVYNGDILNTLLVSPHSTPTLTNSIPVQPLTNATIDGTTPQYAAALSGTIATVTVSGAGQMSPSPAQIAQQIQALGLATAPNQVTQNATALATNSALTTGIALPVGAAADATVSTLGTSIPTGISTTGVPLLTKKQALGNVTSSLAVNGSVSYGPFSVSQPGYEFYLSQYGVAATYGVLQVNLRWTDSTSGVTVAAETWNTGLGSAIADIHQLFGKGPTKADQVTITFTAFLTAANFTYYMFQNSRVYVRDDFRTSGVALALSGPDTTPGNDVPTLLVANRDIAAHGIGATENDILPFYSGRVYLSAHTYSSTTDMTITLNNMSDPNNMSATSIMYQFKSDSLGNINVEFALPRSECQLAIANGNAAAQRQVYSIVAFDE